MNSIQSMVYNLRQKSVQTRKLILVSVSFGLTGLIIVVWISGFVFSHNNRNVAGSVGEKSESPFTIIKDSFVEVYANASKGFDSATGK